MKARDFWMMGGGATASAAVAVLIVGGGSSSMQTEPAARESVSARSEHSTKAVEQTAEALQPRPAQQPASAGPAPANIDRVRSKLATVEKEKRELQQQLRQLEKELSNQESVAAEQARYEFDVTPAEWKELSESAQLKYRVPCKLPKGYTMAPEDLDELGLSPDDGETIIEAHYRSNARVWAAIRPLCEREVGKPEVVDLLGLTSCTELIEKMALQRDPRSVTAARQLVGQVHAGLKPPPKPDDPLHELANVYMTLTSEGGRFEADLANSFGPEEAKRIRQSHRCAITSKPTGKMRRMPMP